MGFRLFNIITTCNNTDDLQVIDSLSERFPMLTVKHFNSGFEGIIGQVNLDSYFESYENNDKISDELYDELYETLYSIEDNLLPFSKEFPDRKFVYIEVDSHGDICLYNGFTAMNGEIQFTHKQLNNSHIPLLQTLSANYNQWNFEPFSRKFIKSE